jgi:4-diphosphocytidyl-2-C-methyl-D-erythritol kinase
MQAISLFDDVTIETTVTAPTSGAGIVVEMAAAPDAPDASRGKFPQGADNLAYRSAELALQLWNLGGEDTTGVRVIIRKRIPMAAGLAGGSADAAVVLLALAHMLSPKTKLGEIIKAGSAIGADVPFCVAAAARGNPALGFSEDATARTAALCEGIGDELSPAAPERGWVVLARPAVDVSTPQIYSDIDDSKRSGGCRRTADRKDDNDLTQPAIERYPLIGVVIDEVKDISGAERVFMTGSGPTVVALYAEEVAAVRGYATLKGAYKNRADIGAVVFSKLLES